MKTNIGISEKNLDSVAALLAGTLADQMTLYVKTRKFHWNVAGESFMELHKLFEEQYKNLEAAIDQTAERINQLGHKTIGTMREFSKMATLKESPGKYPASKDMIKELLQDHESCAVMLRKNVDACAEKYGDAGTADFLTGLLTAHETTAWVLRRYLG